jgi:hypothetical protein
MAHGNCVSNLVRDEQPGDIPAIREMNVRAFEQIALIIASLVLAGCTSYGHDLSPRVTRDHIRADPAWDDTHRSGSPTRKAVCGTSGRTGSHCPDVFAEAFGRSLLSNALGPLAKWQSVRGLLKAIRPLADSRRRAGLLA